MPELAELRHTPNVLARHYSRFRVDERLLLTGHSHQAWPDVAREGLVEAFDDAAREVDQKWERAFAKAGRVREGFRRLLADEEGEIALAASTHDLVVRLLSALAFRERTRIVTSDGEFHTLRRQLTRLEEEGFEIHREPSADTTGLAARLADAVDDRTLAVFVSAVLFESARIVPGLDRLAARCERLGVPLVIDAYHALGVLPFRLPALGLGSAYVLGGGYKYLQLGEGNCMLRVPPEAGLRPLVTGWYAEFDDLPEPRRHERVAYPAGAAAMSGATYDPASHYRAARVLDFFEQMELGDRFLREVSRHQVALLARRFDELDLDPMKIRRPAVDDLAELAGFLALRSPRAGELAQALATRGVAADHRGEWLRLGPAPYLCDAQLETAIAVLGEIVRGA